MWARLVIESVVKKNTRFSPEELIRSIQDYPQEMSEVYEKLPTSLSDRQSKVTVPLLQLMAFNQKPFTLLQMRQAYALVSMADATELSFRNALASLPEENVIRNRIRDTLSGPVEYAALCSYGVDALTSNQKDIYVPWIHGTARLFMIQTGLAKLQSDHGSGLQQKSHQEIFRLCLKIIEFNDLETPLGEYAGDYWMRHAK